MNYKAADILQLGSILGIWAHPDDESWASAGLMRMAVLNGQKVGIITATKGEAGQSADTNRWPNAKMGEIREQELKDCLKCIGNVQQHWLGFSDGKLSSADSAQAVQEIVEIIDKFNPDTIVTFESQGITGHDDHKAIYAWAKAAAKQTNTRLLCAIQSAEKYEQSGEELSEKFDLFFKIDRPKMVSENAADVCVTLPSDVLECKMKCYASHASQTSQILADSAMADKLKSLMSSECFMWEM